MFRSPCNAVLRVGTNSFPLCPAIRCTSKQTIHHKKAMLYRVAFYFCATMEIHAGSAAIELCFQSFMFASSSSFCEMFFSIFIKS